MDIRKICKWYYGPRGHTYILEGKFMTIKNGIKFGIGFVIGQALVMGAAHVLCDCLKAQLKKLEESKQTEGNDVEVE